MARISFRVPTLPYRFSRSDSVSSVSVPFYQLISCGAGQHVVGRQPLHRSVHRNASISLWLSPVFSAILLFCCHSYGAFEQCGGTQCDDLP